MMRRDLLRYFGLSTATYGLRSCFLRAEPAVSRVAGSAVFNQTGFLPGAQKVASVLVKDGGDPAFQVVSAISGKPAFTGTLGAAMLDAASGERVAPADFSSCAEPGLYRIFTQGRRGETFSIGKEVYREPLRLAMRAFYGQRCGCAVDLGGRYSHPACHRDGAFHPSSGKTGKIPGGSGKGGGWHDAGDYGRYVVNSGITTGTLLWAWEMYPEVLRSLALGIPESGGKTPDYLAEIRWNLEWMLQLQDEDGGAWHKQTSEHFCGFIMPEKDAMTSYVIGTGAAPYKSTCATGDLAAVMAIAARCYGPFDDAFAAKCLAAARRAWTWAVSHPDVTFTNPPGVDTGGYGDAHCGDEILWASAELWRTTGDAAYEKTLLAGAEALPPETAVATPGWGNVAPMAWWTYAMAERKGGSKPMCYRVRKQTATAAAALMARQKSSGYGNTLSIADYGWGSNAVAANQSLLLLVARLWAENAEAARGLTEVALGNLHYLLGRNCFGVSWVTQVGTNAFQHPHHRPSAADGIAAPWPGLLSGGPNAHPSDSVADTLPALAPMRMWVDDERAYSMNEVAINWNAPLVFLLAAANAMHS